MWRIPYVLLLVRACRQSKAKLEQIHVLNWAMRTDRDAEAMALLSSANVTAETAIVRYEPALDRAIALAAGLGFLRFEKKSWHLTELARELLAAIDADEDLFAHEKRMLETLSAPLSQSTVKRLLRGRTSD